MAKRMTKQEVATKVDHEGGITETIMYYGLGSDELPKNTPDNVVEAWNRLGGQAKTDVETISAWLFSVDVLPPLQDDLAASILGELRGPDERIEP